MSARISLRDVVFPRGDGRDYVWDANQEWAQPGGGSDEGKVMVTFDVDGQMDIVYADLGQTGDLAALDRAINALTAVRDGLTEVYAGRNHPGRCMAMDDWGRCTFQHGHKRDHDFPTEATSRALTTITSRRAV